MVKASARAGAFCVAVSRMPGKLTLTATKHMGVAVNEHLAWTIRSLSELSMGWGSLTSSPGRVRGYNQMCLGCKTRLRLALPYRHLQGF